MHRPNVAIVGHGRFGAALGDLLEDAGHPVRAHDPAVAVPAHRAATDLAGVTKGARFVVLAVPVERVGPVARALAPALAPDQVVIDVSSVKVRPSEALAAALGGRVPWVATHPLFGPASIARGERPLRVVVCPSTEWPEAEADVATLFRGIDCQVLTMDAHDHDRRMAESHALGFFLAKGLLDAGATFDSPVTPPSSQGIARTIRSVRSDAGHLLGALHGENPYAAEMRGRVLVALEQLDRALANEETRRRSAPEDEELPSLRIPDLGARSPALRKVRDLIDEVDAELVELLGRRALLARRARAVKAGIGAGVRDVAREGQLRADRRGKAAERGLDPDRVDDVFTAILRLSVALQEEEAMDQGLGEDPG
jgi:prephenate dehydrogenase